MARIILTRSANQNLQTVLEYIELDKPEAAERFAKKIVMSVEKLKTFPPLGKIANNIHNPSYRELVIPPCRIFYRVENTIVYIVAVMRMGREVEF